VVIAVGGSIPEESDKDEEQEGGEEPALELRIGILLSPVRG
jgi:hypothetical protein